jgi:leader peptidase (prepilin peptidase)/N-methyltransferase
VLAARMELNMEIIFAIFVFLFGLLIGSFLNVCIYRIPINKSIVFGRSHCIECSEEIKNYDLIPVISYIILGGKCRNCKFKISIKYPVVELLNAIFYLLLFVFYKFSIDFFIYAILTSILIIISFIDYKNKIIPNILVLLILIIGIFSFFFSHQLFWLDRIIGFFAASMPLILAAIISKGGMGGGDIKLMAVCGLILGWKLILISLFVGCIFGTIYGFISRFKNGSFLKAYIPFGPFLSAAMIFSFFLGNTLLNWYASTFLKIM